MQYISTILLCLFIVTATAQQKDSLPKKDTAVFNQVKKMKEVLVISKKSFIEKQIDKTVLNVQADIVASTGNVFEVLQRAPGVSIINEETISMAGKTGVNVLIDGRPTQMSEKDLAAYLKSMPASTVDKVEIISNPSSKYDAQGNAGIINIRLKKNGIKGTNGNMSIAYMLRNHYQFDWSANINHRQGKWNWFASAGVGSANQHTTGNYIRNVNVNGVSKVFENYTVDKDASERYNFLAGADWYINKKSTLGILIKSNFYNNPMFTPGVTLIKSNNRIDSSLLTANDNLQKNNRSNYNLNYGYSDTLGNEWNIDADHINFNNTSSSTVTADLLNDQQIKYGSTANDQAVQTEINIYSIKTDYSKLLKRIHAKLETGFKINTTVTVNDLNASFLNNGAMQVDTGRSNRFRYTENVYAAYMSFNQQKNKWEYQLGLRVERSVAKGNSIDLSNNRINNPDTSYWNVFPTVFIKYQWNDDHQSGISYGRRINRPTYQDLNPFEYQYDNYSSYKGNPYLMPEFTQNIAFNYSYKSLWDIAIGYSSTSNFFQGISTQTGQKTQASEFNVGNEYRTYMNVSLSLPVTKWWDTYNNCTPFYKVYRGAIPSGEISTSAYGMGWYSSQKFTLPKGYKFQLSSWGNITSRDALYKTKWLASIDAGAAKSVWKNKITIKITVLDICNTQRWSQSVQFANMNYSYQRKWESRGIRLQLSWKLGTTNYKQRERSMGAETESNRIK